TGGLYDVKFLFHCLVPYFFEFSLLFAVVETLGRVCRTLFSPRKCSAESADHFFHLKKRSAGSAGHFFHPGNARLGLPTTFLPPKKARLSLPGIFFSQETRGRVCRTYFHVPK
ncbi:MAG: hypothetical protein IIV14_08515, partial [Bacteroidaceae bacterium]|nr:hypothetical protein [Bacteroidaceae bacterium]